MKIRCLAVLLCAITCAAQSRDAEFAKLASRFFDEVVFRYDPVAGTSAGYHQYDKLLAPETSSEIKTQIAALHSWKRDVQSFSPGDLSVAVTLDRDLVLSQIRGQLNF